MTRGQSFESKEVRLGSIPQNASNGRNSDRYQSNQQLRQAIRPGKNAPNRESFSRGYTKLMDVTRAFNFDFRNKIVLDIGSSTGGFTKCALDHGAKKVIAVEKGTNQMVKPLRYDKRIDLHEKTDIFSVRIQDDSTRRNPESDKSRMGAVRPLRQVGQMQPETELSCSPDVIVADVSFISLKKVLSYARNHLSNKDTSFLVMLKPQFEATPDQLLNGITKNHKIRHAIIAKFEQWLKDNNFVVVKKRDNQLKGKNGNIERFYWLKRITTRG